MCKVVHRNCKNELVGAALDGRNRPAAEEREAGRKASILLEARE